MMDNTVKINSLISEFDSLVARRNKAEKWFDEPTTTDADRDKWKDNIFKLSNGIEVKAEEFRSLGFIVQDKFYLYGIMPSLAEGEGENER